MNKEQQTFVNEMLRHGDKTKAYRYAYPDAKTDKAIESSVNRLLKHPEVKQAIDEPTTRLKAEAKAEVEAELKERMKAELLSFHEAQVTLTNIIRGTHTTEKWVKEKEGWKTIEVKPTQSNIISALNTYFRLNGLYPQKKTAAQLKAEEQEHKVATAKKWEPDPELKRIMKEAAENPYRHPFGDIYPPEYPGPWYDPKDPNTREQFLAITEPYRLKKLAQQDTTIKAVISNEVQRREKSPEPMQAARPERYDNTQMEAVISNEVQHREKSPEPMQADRPERQDNTAALQEISPYGRNDDHFSAQQFTTENNTESSPPVLRRGGPQDRGGDPQHEQHTSPAALRENTTTVPHPDSNREGENNKVPPSGSGEGSVPPSGGGGGKRFSTGVQQMLLRDALRKQGWMTIEDAFNMAHDIYIRNQHSGTRKMMQLFEKAKNARNYPPNLREPIEKETGWTFHPKYPNMMRRTRALGW